MTSASTELRFRLLRSLGEGKHENAPVFFDGRIRIREICA